MKNISKKKLIIIIVLVLVVIGTAAGVTLWLTRDKEEKKVTVTNTNKDILAGAQVNGILIKDIKLEITDGMSTYKAVAINNTDATIEVDGFAITFYEDAKDIGTIQVFLDTKLKPGEQAELSNYSDINFTNATSAKYEMVSR